MSAKQQKIKIQLDRRYTSIERKFIAEDIINQIRKRTNSGIGVTGSLSSTGTYSTTYKFPSYGKNYTSSVDFRAAGKTSKVDLDLSGDMLTEIDILDNSEGHVVIGFKEGTEENNRAEGNIIGSYGKDKANKSKARNFLGVTSSELHEILIKYPVKDLQNQEILTQIDQIDIFENLDFDFLK